jgi:hypothetical protein
MEPKARDCVWQVIMSPGSDYQSFWLLYLAAHRRAATRMLHMIGTALGSLLLLAGLILLNGWMLLAAPVIGYGLAWLSHSFVERNRPATFEHPVWSFLSDFRMLYLWLGGRLQDELRRHGLDAANSD